MGQLNLVATFFYLNPVNMLQFFTKLNGDLFIFILIYRFQIENLQQSCVIASLPLSNATFLLSKYKKTPNNYIHIRDYFYLKIFKKNPLLSVRNKMVHLSLDINDSVSYRPGSP